MSLATLLLFLYAQHVSGIIMLISGARDYAVKLSHWSFPSWFAVCWRFGAVGLEWCPGFRLKHNSSCALA